MSKTNNKAGTHLHLKVGWETCLGYSRARCSAGALASGEAQRKMNRAYWRGKKWVLSWAMVKIQRNTIFY